MVDHEDKIFVKIGMHYRDLKLSFEFLNSNNKKEKGEAIKEGEYKNLIDMPRPSLKIIWFC